MKSLRFSLAIVWTMLTEHLSTKSTLDFAEFKNLHSLLNFQSFSWIGKSCQKSVTFLLVQFLYTCHFDNDKLLIFAFSKIVRKCGWWTHFLWCALGKSLRTELYPNFGMEICVGKLERLDFRSAAKRLLPRESIVGYRENNKFIYYLPYFKALEQP